MTPAPIQARGVRVVFDGRTALDHVDLEVPEGDLVGVLGPNGSGKTTLLRTLLGLQTPTAGHAELYGRPARRFADRARVGYVPQHAVEIDRRFPASALEVVLLGRVGQRGLLRRLTRRDREQAHQALERVGVADLAERRIGELSGGQRQRVMLAKALASEPDLLVLDEPTTGVDPGAREAFYNLVDRLNHDEGKTVLLVSHDAQAVRAVAHRVVVLDRRILFDGTPDALEAAGGLSSFLGLHVHHEGEACDHG